MDYLQLALEEEYKHLGEAKEEGNKEAATHHAKQVVLLGAAFDARFGVSYEHPTMLGTTAAAELDKQAEALVERYGKSTRGE